MATYAGYTYENGYVPRAVLAPLDGENYGDAELRRDAAEAWNRARADVKARTGIVLTVRGWNRTIAEQERFFFERYDEQATGSGPFGDVRWYKGVRYVRTSGAPAAIPGNSNHGWGLAVDIDDFGAYRTLGNDRSAKATPILERHGWTDDEGSSIGEPWHRVYKPASDTHPEPFQEDDMTPDEHTALIQTRSDAAAILSAVSAMVADVSAPEEGITQRRALERDLAVARRSETRIIALDAKVDALIENAGADAAAITTAVLAKVDAALSNLEITLSTED
jgi:hypothetical protein